MYIYVYSICVRRIFLLLRNLIRGVQVYIEVYINTAWYTSTFLK